MNDSDNDMLESSSKAIIRYEANEVASKSKCSRSQNKRSKKEPDITKDEFQGETMIGGKDGLGSK